ncbi:SpoIIE family protein phosphatase [Streptomyces sp. NPDC059850]|uniref:SpoIIE family protein phosphatase n=1 Tax=Streptomyces sp. NPDC059850 TaxID=3346970 RepID=UPI003667EECD
MSPAPDPTGRERVLAFAGVSLAAVYVLGDGSDGLRLVETTKAAGADADAAPHAALPQHYALSGRSPAADALCTGRPLWLDSAALASYQQDGVAVRWPGASLGALPLGTEGSRLGCLLIVGSAADGFETEQRGFLLRYADAIATRLRGAGASATAPGAGATTLLGPALRSLRVGSFVLLPGTGLIEADATLLDLIGIAPDDFNGTVDALLARTVPEDLPALLSVVEPAAQVAGDRELEFRIRRPTGEVRWLRLSCRVSTDAAGRPERVVGVVTSAAALRSRADDVSRVQWLTTALDNAMTVRDVSRVVVAALGEPLGADRVALAELQADRLVVVGLDPPQADAWPELWRSEWHSEWPDASLHALPSLRAALREGRPRLWPAGAALEPGLAGIGPGGLAVLPLPAHGQVAGVCLIGWDAPHPFGPEERSLLTATAGLVGQTLMRAHAYDAEQELATMLQRSLLPRSLPPLPGGVAVARYLPAMRGLQVGGDWYDVIALSESRVALVIGDVQGHSAAAATIMGQMRTAVRAYAVEGHPPDVVVSHANRLLVGMEADLFATCAYVELDMEEGNAWFVRAGHVAPLVRRPDGTTEEVAVEGGLPLGVVADAEFPMTAEPLAPGTVLALLTDGLVESSTLHLDEGMRRMRAALTTAPTDLGRMADALLAVADQRHDDVALLLLRYDGMRVRPIRAGWLVWRLPDAVMHARRFTARTLRSWGLVDQADTTLLVVSELVTNALMHTHGTVRLDLTYAADRIRVTVTDSSPRAPAKPVVTDWEATGGRGLLLVEAMSASWGSVPAGGGKQVWSEIVVPPRAPGVAGPGDTEPGDTEPGPRVRQGGG